MLFLGRAMIHPDGLSVAARVPEERPERARHHAPVLRRQQPGRDHGRRPDRGGARLRPRGARRARHELLDAASAQRGLRHRTRQIIYPSYPTVIDRQLWLSQIQLLWDRGEANGYAQHMTTDPLPDTPRAHTCSCTSRSATIRCRTRRPRSRRARSARAPTQPALDRRALAVAALPADPVDRELPVQWLGHRALGHRAGADGRHGDGGHGRAAVHEHAEQDAATTRTRTRAPPRARAPRSPSSLG